MSLLYFLFHADGSAVKIGRSINPRVRASQPPVPIDLSRSFEIEFTTGSASAAERMLHDLFRAQKHPMPPGDGHTEWFRMDTLPEILNFL